MEPYETFYVDDAGYTCGRPYVLPHKPGEQAFGLIEGWYFFLPNDDDPVGPFTSHDDALEEVAFCLK